MHQALLETLLPGRLGDRQAVPYHDAIPWWKIQEVMSEQAGKGLDANCVHARERWQDRNQFHSRVEAQMAEVDRLLAEL